MTRTIGIEHSCLLCILVLGAYELVLLGRDKISLYIVSAISNNLKYTVGKLTEELSSLFLFGTDKDINIFVIKNLYVYYQIRAPTATTILIK